MTTATARPVARTDAGLLRVLHTGIALTAVGLVVEAMTGTFWTTVDGGDFRYAADYWYTASAAPIGVGALLHVLAIHRLHRGRAGRIGATGAWLFALCVAELVVQCLASVAVGSELRWGPMYVLCSLGTFVGLALLAAGSWRAGLVPRWMLGVWPPLWLLGSFFGVGLLPIGLAAFLVAFGLVLTRRVGSVPPA